MEAYTDTVSLKKTECQNNVQLILLIFFNTKY